MKKRVEGLGFRVEGEEKGDGASTKKGDRVQDEEGVQGTGYRGQGTGKKKAMEARKGYRVYDEEKDKKRNKMKQVKKESKVPIQKNSGSKGKKPLERQKIKSDKSPELRVLILEDNAADAELMERQLQRDGIAFRAQRAASRGGFIKALSTFTPDVILADYTLPKFNALQALELARKQFAAIPFIVITGSIGEEKAVACLRAGADDYLLKDRLARLGEAVRRALESRRRLLEKMEAEQTIRTSEENFADIFQTVKDGIAYTSLLGKVISINPALEQILQIPREKILGKNILYLAKKLLSKENIKKTVPLLNKLIRGESSVEFQFEYKDRVLEVHPNINRKTKRLTGVVRDITERKQAQGQIEHAARKWSTTFDAIKEGIALLGADQTVLQANKAFATLLGMPFQKIIGKKCHELIHDDRRPHPQCPFKKMLKSKKRESMELAIAGRLFDILVDPITDDAGTITGAAHIMSDITERKRAEEEIKKITSVVEQSTEGIAIAGLDGILSFVNKSWCRMHGYKSSQELIGKSLAIFHNQEQMENEVKLFNEKVIELGAYSGEIGHITCDGKPFPTLMTTTILKDNQGRPYALAGIAKDITERKRAEEVRFEALARFSGFSKASQYGMGMADLNGHIVYVNSTLVRLLGEKSVDECLGKHFPSAYYSTSIANKLIKKVFPVLMRDGHWQGELELLSKDGRRVPTDENYFIIRDKNGQPRYIADILTDITERKQSQELLQATSRRLQLALDSAKAGTWDWDVVTGHIVWSPQMFALFGLDPQTSNASFESWRKALHPEDRDQAEKRIEHALKQHKKLDSDYRIILPGGQIRWINAMGIGVYDAAGHPAQMIGICQDISERKRDEEQVRNSLREKEVLLKEIHHRVKNNLQIISGLLTLQAAQIDNEQLQRIIKESQGRIWTMALIHQTLYQSGSLADIDMADYIHGLSGNLLSSQARIAMPPNITFDLTSLRLPIDKAIPLALIVNELVTNTLKHAFPDGQAGEIRITLRCCSDRSRPVTTDNMGEKSNKNKSRPVTTDNMDETPIEGTAFPSALYELIVADDGVGLPADFDPKSQKSLGLQLVTMLTKQLNGTLAIESRGGASVRITFNINEKSKKQA